ncbi:hypothetical protein PG985_015113 [Apiospora marii]|uniref:C2H2-type domain-containing protein n=1 Tax=Apiospora marii TaxID=335849 RepID=A0ABR1RME7_9PEZI
MLNEGYNVQLPKVDGGPWGCNWSVSSGSDSQLNSFKPTPLLLEEYPWKTAGDLDLALRAHKLLWTTVLAIEYDSGWALQKCLALGQKDSFLHNLGEKLGIPSTQNNPLCIASTQNKPDIIHILLSNGADYGLARQLLQHAGLTNVVEILITAALRYYLAWTSDPETQAPLRSRFYVEYDTITKNVFYTSRDSNTPIESHNTVYYEWGPHSSRKSAESAWLNSLAILKKACRGNLPRTAHGVLLFTSLAKAMSSEIDEKQGSTLTQDLMADLNRWNILMYTNPNELEALTQAIWNVWHIDIRKQTSNSDIHVDSSPADGFMEMLQHLQDVANDLVQTSHEVLANPDPSAQQAITVREDTSRRLSKVELDALEQRHGHTPRPPKPPDKRSQVAGVVLIVMAGVAFATVFAYLISKTYISSSSLPGTDTIHLVTRCRAERCREHWQRTNNIACSIIAGDNPVACGTAMFRYPTTTQPLVYVAAYNERCDAAKIVEKTYLLLSLLLGYLYPATPGNLVTELSSEEHRDDAMSSTTPTTTESGSHTPRAARADSPLVEAQLLPTSRNKIGSDFPCPQCPRMFPKVGLLNRHIREKHTDLRFPCSIPGCGRVFKRNCYRKDHERTQHSGPASQPPVLPSAFHRLPVVQRPESVFSPSPGHRAKRARVCKENNAGGEHTSV